MQISKIKLKKYMLLVCISLFFGVIIAFMYAGYKWIQAGERKGKHQIDDTYIRYSREVEYTKGKYSVSSQGGKLIINFPEKMYINKLTFEYASEFFSDCSLDIEKENIYGVVENLSIQDKLMKDMPRSVVNIGGIVSKIYQYSLAGKGSKRAITSFKKQIKWAYANRRTFMFTLIN